MNFSQLLDQFREPITQAIIRMYPPIVLPKGPDARDLQPLVRRPKGAQADAIRAAAHSLRRDVATTIVGEMGTGKTLIGIAAVREAGFRRPLILCPPQLPEKWRREVLQTIPGASAVIVRSITDLEQVRRDRSPFVATIMSREKAKLGPNWQPAVFHIPRRQGPGWTGRHVFDWRQRAALRETLTEKINGDLRAVGRTIIRQPACPDCGALIKCDDGTLSRPEALARKRLHCTAEVSHQPRGKHRLCGGALWSVTPTPKRAALADYIREHMPGCFDVVIADEWHEFKAKGSAQGIAVAAVIGACGRVLALTGTLFGGYSSTLFYLLYRADPLIRAEYGWKDEAKWVARYGISEQIDTLDDDDDADGRTSKRKVTASRIQERPGITPGILLRLIRNTVFLHLQDVADDLPPYRERVIAVRMDTEALPLLDPKTGEPRRDERGEVMRDSQAGIYQQFAHDLHEAVKEALVHNSKRLLGAYLQALLGWVDSPFREEAVYDPREVRRIAQLQAELPGAPLQAIPIATAPALPDERLYPKEQALLDLCRDNQRRGRRVMIYVQHTGTRDILPRLQSILARQGIRAAVLRANTVSPEKREAWLADRVKEGVDACLAHPRLVQTGLDLLHFPSICWYQGEYSVYTMRQASRRSWRLGQVSDVEVSHLAYDATLQTAQLALVSAKLRSSLLLEGHMQTDGLAALEGDEGDTFVQLARRLTEEAEDELPDAQAALEELSTLEAEGNDDLLSEETREELARVFADQPEVPALIPFPERVVGPMMIESEAAEQPDTAPEAPAESSPAVQSRQLSFLDLRAELARRGAKLPKARIRKPTPGQVSLFDLTQREAS